MIEFSGYLEKLKLKIAASKNLQSTRHQQDALDTMMAFQDFRNFKKDFSIIARMFKKYDREKLIKCREWVVSKIDVHYRTKTFVKTFFKKFR